jgi:hypothetical protein
MSVIILSFSFIYCYVKCNYAEWRYVEWHNVEWHNAEWHNAEWHYAEWHYVQWHYAEWHYDECNCVVRHYVECHGTSNFFLNFLIFNHFLSPVASGRIRTLHLRILS